MATKPAEQPGLEPLFRAVKANTPRQTWPAGAGVLTAEHHGGQMRKSGDPYITHRSP
jgi:GTP pyrophosphokinase